MTLSQLAPKSIWTWFQFICNIPHPSMHEQNLSQAIIAWAQQQQLDCLIDDVGNLLIRKPATKGMESRKTVVLQAHLDMVPQKNNDKVHDFVNDPIDAYVDGEWVTARGTTLGADNGIGLAACLAILEDNHLIVHPDLEVLFTMSEETGMNGAFGLQPNWLTGSILLNTDSEQEGEVYVGCAGGVDFINKLLISTCSVDKKEQNNKIALLIKVQGLRGGHSGCDINTGRANAILLLANFINHHLDFDFELAHFVGGSLRNAIPREANCCVLFDSSNSAAFECALNNYLEQIQKTYKSIENTISLTFEPVALPDTVYDAPSKQRLLHFLSACPNGVIAMSQAFNNVVETSLNLGVVSHIVEGNNTYVTTNFLIRSLNEFGKSQVVDKLISLSALANIDYQCDGDYPGWQPNINSPIMKLFRERYQTIYDKKPEINVVHAGLECGLFQRPYPNMDMLSFGPTIKFPHSPDEKVHIHSVQLFWAQLIDLLKHIPIR